MAPLPCRLCLEPKKRKIDIFDRRRGNNERIDISITKLFSFTVNPTDKLRLICVKCMKLVKKFNEYYSLVRKSQVFLAKTGSTVDDYSKNMCLDTIKTDEVKFEISVLPNSYVFNDTIITQKASDNIKNEISVMEATNDKSVIDATGELKSEIIDSKPWLLPNIISNRSNPKMHSNMSSSEAIKKLFQRMECNVTVNNGNSRKSKMTAMKTIAKNSSHESDDDDHFDNDSIGTHSQNETETVFPDEIMKDGFFVLKGDKMHKLITKFYNLRCEICLNKRKFTNFSEMCRHYKTTHDTAGYVTCCGKKFSGWEVIKCHMVSHLQPEALQCPICQVKSSNTISLKNHMRRHVPVTERTHKCEQCGRGCITAFALKQHLLTHRSYEETHPYTCDICGKSFNKHYFQIHQTFAHTNTVGTHLCPKCGRCFRNKYGLQYHLKFHDSSDERRTKCKECLTVFDSPSDLRDHIVIMHGDILSLCTLCNYSTRKPVMLRRHMKIRHTELTPHKCSLCHKEFKLKRSLITHMAQHTGEKKYACVYCPMTFAAPSNFYIHRKRKHLEQYIRDSELANVNKPVKILKVKSKRPRKDSNMSDSLPPLEEV